MARKKERKEKRPRKKRTTLKAILHYVFLWPTIRSYFMWFKYVKHKKKGGKKEKIVIIED
jgi:hypothetical protein